MRSCQEINIREICLVMFTISLKTVESLSISPIVKKNICKAVKYDTDFKCYMSNIKVNKNQF